MGLTSAHSPQVIENTAIADSAALKLSALDALASIVRDASAPAAARGAAARTILEVVGAIGRHAEPDRDTTDKAASTMSRAEIEEELRRLRASH